MSKYTHGKPRLMGCGHATIYYDGERPICPFCSNISKVTGLRQENGFGFPRWFPEARICPECKVPTDWDIFHEHVANCDGSEWPQMEDLASDPSLLRRRLEFMQADVFMTEEQYDEAVDIALHLLDVTVMRDRMVAVDQRINRLRTFEKRVG